MDLSEPSSNSCSSSSFGKQCTPPGAAAEAPRLNRALVNTFEIEDVRPWGGAESFKDSLPAHFRKPS